MTEEDTQHPHLATMILYTHMHRHINAHIHTHACIHTHTHTLDGKVTKHLKVHITSKEKQQCCIFKQPIYAYCPLLFLLFCVCYRVRIWDGKMDNGFCREFNQCSVLPYLLLSLLFFSFDDTVLTMSLKSHNNSESHTQDCFAF